MRLISERGQFDDFKEWHFEGFDKGITVNAKFKFTKGQNMLLHILPLLISSFIF